MYSGRSTRALPRVGFPIRKSPDQRMVSSFPGLIAAAHVLHRLLAPRHPPCALRHLTRKNTFYCRYGVFKVRVGSSSVMEGARPREDPPAGREAGARSLKTQQRGVRGRGRRSSRRARGIGRPTIAGKANERVSAIERARTPSGVSAPLFPRKEVIQPQLPLRLPCYDFTPIINPTFDGCLPEGLAHRLRVLPTFVV